MKYPDEKECLEILRKHNVNPGVIEHSKRVAKIASKLADELIKRNVKVNKELVIAGALLHDIKKLKEKDHEVAGANFLKKLGCSEIAEIAKRHVARSSNEYLPRSIEEKIVFYADKRVNPDGIVSLKKRFDYAKKRYNVPDEELKKRFMIVEKIEKEIFNSIGLDSNELTFE